MSDDRPKTNHRLQRVSYSASEATILRRFPGLHIDLPDWVSSAIPSRNHVYETTEERMWLAVELSRLNVEQGTGGPFGAAVFDMERHTLLAPGVNVVVNARWSGGHAEMVAYAVAQQLVGAHDLGSCGLPSYELVTSTEPCAMCFGATPWSGVRRIVCGARDADAREIGFDEGPKMPGWADALRARGIEVLVDVLRHEAKAVLTKYVRDGGRIYNGRTG